MDKSDEIDDYLGSPSGSTFSDGEIDENLGAPIDWRRMNTGMENKNSAQDFLTSVSLGLHDAARAGTGVLDMLSGGMATKAWGKALDEWDRNTELEYSPARYEGMQSFQEDKEKYGGGFTGTLASYAMNPGEAVHDATRSLVPMVATIPAGAVGGGIRAAQLANAGSQTAKAIQAASKASIGSTISASSVNKMLQSQAVKSAVAADAGRAASIGRYAAGGAAIAEGMQSAGSAANAIVSDNLANGRDPSQGLIYTVPIGIATAAAVPFMGLFGGAYEAKLAADVALRRAVNSGKLSMTEARRISNNPGLLRKFVYEPLSAGGKEGIQEMLQGVGETGFQNLATEKPFSEGMGENLASGLVAGGLMGTAMHGAHSLLKNGNIKEKQGYQAPVSDLAPKQTASLAPAQTSVNLPFNEQGRLQGGFAPEMPKNEAQEQQDAPRFMLQKSMAKAEELETPRGTLSSLVRRHAALKGQLAQELGTVFDDINEEQGFVAKPVDMTNAAETVLKPVEGKAPSRSDVINRLQNKANALSGTGANAQQKARASLFYEAALRLNGMQPEIAKQQASSWRIERLVPTSDDIAETLGRVKEILPGIALTGSKEEKSRTISRILSDASPISKVIQSLARSRAAVNGKALSFDAYKGILQDSGVVEEEINKIAEEYGEDAAKPVGRYVADRLDELQKGLEDQYGVDAQALDVASRVFRGENISDAMKMMTAAFIGRRNSEANKPKETKPRNKPAGTKPSNKPAEATLPTAPQTQQQTLPAAQTTEQEAASGVSQLLDKGEEAELVTQNGMGVRKDVSDQSTRADLNAKKDFRELLGLAVSRLTEMNPQVATAVQGLFDGETELLPDDPNTQKAMNLLQGAWNDVSGRIIDDIKKKINSGRTNQLKRDYVSSLITEYLRLANFMYYDPTERASKAARDPVWIGLFETSQALKRKAIADGELSYQQSSIETRDDPLRLANVEHATLDDSSERTSDEVRVSITNTPAEDFEDSAKQKMEYWRPITPEDAKTIVANEKTGIFKKMKYEDAENQKMKNWKPITPQEGANIAFQDNTGIFYNVDTEMEGPAISFGVIKGKEVPSQIAKAVSQCFSPHISKGFITACNKLLSLGIALPKGTFVDCSYGFYPSEIFKGRDAMAGITVYQGATTLIGIRGIPSFDGFSQEMVDMCNSVISLHEMFHSISDRTKSNLGDLMGRDWTFGLDIVGYGANILEMENVFTEIRDNANKLLGDDKDRYAKSLCEKYGLPSLSAEELYLLQDQITYPRSRFSGYAKEYATMPYPKQKEARKPDQVLNAERYATLMSNALLNPAFAKVLESDRFMQVRRAIVRERNELIKLTKAGEINVRILQSNGSSEFAGNSTQIARREPQAIIGNAKVNGSGRTAVGSATENNAGRGKAASSRARETSRGASQEVRHQSDLSKKLFDGLVSRLPERRVVAGHIIKPKEVSRNVADTLFKSRLGFAFTESLIKWASKQYGYAETAPMRKFYSSLVSMRAEREARTRALEYIAERATKLDASQKAKINEHMLACTKSEVWAYRAPEVFKTESSWRDYLNKLSDKDKDIQKALAKEFNALTAEQQGVVRDVFKQGVEDWKTRHNFMKERMQEDPSAADSELYASIEDESKRAPYPYIPLGRMGDYFVAEYSKELTEASKAYNAAKQATRDAEAKYGDDSVQADAAKEAESNAQAEYEKLRNDSDHYALYSFDTAGEALAKEDEIKAAGKEPKTWERTKLTRGDIPSWLGLERIKAQIESDPTYENNKAMMNGVTHAITQVYLRTLCDQTARRQMLKRKGTAGYSQNALENWLKHGRATAAMFSNMHHIKDISRSIREMELMAHTATKDNLELSQINNELFQRYGMMLEKPGNNALTNGVLKSTSAFLLVWSPAFYIQNIFQPYMMSMPMISGRFGATRTFGMLNSAMKEVAGWLRKDMSFKNIDEVVTSEDERNAIKLARDHNRIDFGQASDIDTIGDMEDEPTTFLGKLYKKSTKLVRGTETLIRTATFLTAYRLAKADPSKLKNGQTAQEYAEEVVYETHGDYSDINAPRYFKMNALTKMMTQFRKFQLIQLGYICRLWDTAFRDADPKERLVARQALLYTLSAYFTTAGLLGTPIVASAIALVASLFGEGGDDDEDTLRELIGDKFLADCLLRGFPKAMGIDLSTKIGGGDVLNPYPFMDWSKTGDSFAGTLAMNIGGAAVNTFATSTGKFLEYWAQGDSQKAIEYIVPNGVFRNALRAYRYYTEGMTTKAGVIEVDGKEYGVGDAIAQIAGFPLNLTTDRNRLKGSKIRNEAYYNEKFTKLRRDYEKAKDSRDYRAISEIKREFDKLNQEYFKKGFKRKDFKTSIIKPAEDRLKASRKTIGGVSYTNSDRGFLANRADK